MWTTTFSVRGTVQGCTEREGLSAETPDKGWRSVEGGGRGEKALVRVRRVASAVLSQCIKCRAHDAHLRRECALHCVSVVHVSRVRAVLH